MYPSNAEIQVLNSAEKLMEKTMHSYDSSHDKHHVQRVRRTALALANSLPEKPDMLVVELSALLHDVLDKKYVSLDVASDPFSFFLPFFESVKSHVDLVVTGQAALVAKIVENVSWSTENMLRADGKITEWHKTCFELHCVQDADRLDAIGAFGGLHIHCYISISRPLHASNDDSHSGETAVAHFHDKLLKIKDRLKTESGKKLGEERHSLMLNFLGALDKEYGYGDKLHDSLRSKEGI
ncbi:hypothetical protein EW145_g6918 [Phellinidium pouzarii]|uniref:HD/PDEase domain-containing protein n=1 Tax=Phellinidium pouzarii TaxID=167371 RepID=A0A4S4KTM2_9AGAM|nr:hypothetical protein EW145_g6918 [Phellinidium pouzarii]